MGEGRELAAQLIRRYEPGLLPEIKREIKVTPEQIKAWMITLRHLIVDFDIMLDDFMMPEIYSVTDDNSPNKIDFDKMKRLENAKKNKLRTNWFTSVLGYMEIILVKMKWDKIRYKQLWLEHELLKEQEDAFAGLVRQNKIRVLDLIDKPYVSAEDDQLNKEAKREVAPLFVQDKIELIERLEVYMNELTIRLHNQLSQK